MKSFLENSDGGVPLTAGLSSGRQEHMAARFMPANAEVHENCSENRFRGSISHRVLRRESQRHRSGEPAGLRFEHGRARYLPCEDRPAIEYAEPFPHLEALSPPPRC
jgi:hypothetical protein